MSKQLAQTKEKGFTLIEMMVSVTIFALVLVIAMGAILTIVDASRKSRTLTSVMNNISFAFDNMTRTIKSGIDAEVLSGGDGLKVCAIDFTQVGQGFDRVDVYYRLNSETIEKCTASSCGSATCNTYAPITASEVKVENLKFDVFADGSAVTTGTADQFEQPRVAVTIAGVVQLNRIESEFSMQTTVAQRRLNIDP